MLKGYWLILFISFLYLVVSAVDGVDKGLEKSETKTARDNKCGEKLTWSLKGGTLTIRGTGSMTNYSEFSDVPWVDSRNSIQTIVIEKGATSIGDRAFAYLNKLRTATIPFGVVSIGYYAFYSCPSLKSIAFPDSVTYIGMHSFHYCTSLKTVTIGRNVTEVSTAAFYGCYGLTSVSIPASVTIIRDQAFHRCPNLTTISVDKGNKNFKSIDGVLFNYDCSTLIRYPAGNKTENYTIPDGVKTIGRYAFGESGILVTVSIPDSVTSIERRAFHLCTQLQTVLYQGYNTFSEPSIFDECDALVNLCVPPDFDGDTFCGKIVSAPTQVCQDYQMVFNQCYQAALIDGELISQKRENATEWENHYNGCVEYRCDNETGSITPFKCGTTDDVSKLCINNECVERKNFTNFMVEIEIEDELNLEEINESINRMKTLFGFDEGSRIGWEANEEEHSILVVVFVSDEETAYTIADKMILCANQNDEDETNSSSFETSSSFE